MENENKIIIKEQNMRMDLSNAIRNLKHFHFVIPGLCSLLDTFTIIPEDTIEDIRGDLELANDLLGASIRQLVEGLCKQKDKIKYLKTQERKISWYGRKCTKKLTQFAQ